MSEPWAGVTVLRRDQVRRLKAGRRHTCRMMDGGRGDGMKGVNWTFVRSHVPRARGRYD